ncbi:NADH dehydrogenase (ubiquinone) complex I, assembly factor 6 [Porphyridium purpureum]|uniref:NADH dehydrogenase (Ubiquinone) complex I, assembly factor 6 n=1 Tax=Porphyridium purpureum TaxID=35688 RepID=A0A5J4YKQ1_PORPP|nr:NADH dehydrogenase (ubiquinone) complex I, assembly factor 6 [Porphyridium purpureum]|eukprot:POR1352..scf249_10
MAQRARAHVRATARFKQGLHRQTEQNRTERNGTQTGLGSCCRGTVRRMDCAAGGCLKRLVRPWFAAQRGMFAPDRQSRGWQRRALAVAAPSATHTAPSGAMSRKHALSYCMELMRQHERLQFFAHLLQPTDIKPLHAGLRALRIELLRAVSPVSVHADPQRAVQRDLSSIQPADLKRLRLEWIRAGLQQVMDTRAQDKAQMQNLGSPVLQLLAEELHGTHAGQERRVSRMWLTRLVDSAEARLDAMQRAYMWESTAQLEAELGDKDHAGVLRLQLEAMNVRSSICDHAAAHLGNALAIVENLAASASLARQAKVSVPRDVVQKCDAQPAFWFKYVGSHSSGERSDNTLESDEAKQLDAWTHAHYELACQAKQHLHTARSFETAIREKSREHARAASCAFLGGAAIAERFLLTFERTASFNPVLLPAAGLSASPVPVQWRMARNRLLRTF